jgi:hypothetical protein
MNTGEDQVRSARHLFAGTFYGVLSTHSVEHSGYPFGSVVPYVPDRDGNPLMLLSHLSQHTHNLDADGRCSLTVVEAGEGDVQTRARLSALGDAFAADPSEELQRYFAYLPQTRVYYEQLGFRFYRFRPRRFHWNGGFATARWFDASRILRANSFDPETEQQILAQLNRTDAEALLRALADGVAPDIGVAAVGIDGEGLDLRVGDRLWRIGLSREVTTAAEAQTVLAGMVGRDV